MANINLGDFGYTVYRDLRGSHVRIHVEESLLMDDAHLTYSVSTPEITVDVISPDGDGGDGGDEGDA